ncbi:hypothetical protein [Paenibacillus xanthanilyticus]|uniref:Uncharacterized protein n=1 Tax=Paenibacillus xanthanilyticus TaxID=1783531 RepID=A0ABV8K256_9BACL
MAEQCVVHEESMAQDPVSPATTSITSTSQKVDELLQRNRVAIVKHHEQITLANNRIRTTQAFLEAVRSAQADVRHMPGWETPPRDRQAH